MRANTAIHTRAPQRCDQSKNENEQQTSRKIASAKSADYRRLVARATQDAVRDWDLSTNSLLWREGLDTLLGYAVSSETNVLSFWQQRLHPDDRARVAASIRDAIKSKSHRWSGEYRLRDRDNHFRHLLERAAIVRDGNGKAVRFVGALMDITARKQLQDQLCRSQKMEAFGQLAGGMAHDLNNFLTAILGYSDLVIGEIAAAGTIASYMSEIRTAAGRASSLARQLLAFSRRQSLEPRILEVNTLINNLERSVLRLLGEHISILCELLPEKHFIQVDPNQFAQIIVNVAVNARDAMPNGGTLILKAETVSLNGNSPFSGELAAGEYVLISAIDNGCGMNEETKAHVFEPFFTTKHDRQCSGLGLAACYGIVRQSGGHIAIESEPDKGTAVRIYLPKAAPPVAQRARANTDLPKGTETVLVVEDEISVRHVAVRTLRMLGYRVFEAGGADVAKRLIGEKRSAIDLVVTDIMLPDMSGREFAHWARVHTPHTQILLISGYLPESGNDHDHDGSLLLAKPFDREQLAVAVRKALGTAAKG